MRNKWTDERLDDLNDRVSEGFVRIDADLLEVRGSMDSNFAGIRAQTNAGFVRIDERLAKMDERFDALHRLIIRGGAAMFAVVLAAILAGHI